MSAAADAAGHGVLAAARRSGLLPPGGNVVVMVSGGADSVCLLDVAVRLAGSRSVAALHVNHGLRPDAGENALCRETCERLGVDLAVEALDPTNARGNIQAWAREQRYAAAARIAEPRDAAIAVGHTASDQAETVLYRLAAAPGRRALLGMSARSGSLIRPLLGVDRDATEAYCRARALEWIDDPSNATAAFARNRVRASLVTALREVHPAAEANVVATAQILRDEAEVLDGIVDSLFDSNGEGRSIPLERLRSQPPALRRLAVQRLADEAVGGLAPGVARRCDEIASLSDKGRAMLDLPSGVRAIAERGVLRFAARSADG